ncbi:MAG: RecX family transcriptional regulator [Saprospiraceae bacterium]|nr:RecX family transcriptional regulator [Saprospiraceae bacterium]
MDKPKYISKQQALQKLQRYCAFQERSHYEVRSKLLSLGIYGEDLEQVMSELVESGFLNEERFARSFARGKFNMKKWGRVRITQELKRRQISAWCIRKAMEEIEPEAYSETLAALLRKKAVEYSENPPHERRAKLMRYGLQKGYESELIQELLPE